MFEISNSVGDKYLCTKKLGEGGFACVYSGFSRSGVPVAIKKIKATGDINDEIQSFKNELHILQACQDIPNVVRICDAFSCDGFLFYVMERANNSLHDYLMLNRPANIFDVCSVGIQIASALEHIHKRGFVHRDVTPKNILHFGGGVFKISDFGISRDTLGWTQLATTLIGCPQFIAPELLGYNRITPCATHQSDIYQLGCVLISLYLGGYFISGDESRDEIKNLILGGYPRLLAEEMQKSDDLLVRLLGKTLRKMVCRSLPLRFFNAREVIAELTAIQSVIRMM